MQTFQKVSARTTDTALTIWTGLLLAVLVAATPRKQRKNLV